MQIQLSQGDRTVTFLQLKAYLARLFVNETCTMPFDRITECTTSVSIEPSRQTSMKHLKDGLVNGLTRQSHIEPFDKTAMEEFKKLFPIGLLDKNEKIVFTKNKDQLCLNVKDKECGCVANEWLATAFMNLYFSKRHSVVPLAQQAAEVKYNEFFKSQFRQGYSMK